MLTIIVPGTDMFDDAKQEFFTSPAVTLELEHSLFSLSKWESKWEIPFLGGTEKTTEQTLDYIRVMTISPDVPAEVYDRLTSTNLQAINEYINAKMTATWFKEAPGPKNRGEAITAEIIYYWLVSHTIPFECQHWHLNRLITLIKVCNEKNAPKKKMSRRELLAQQRQLNAERRANLNTSG